MRLYTDLPFTCVTCEMEISGSPVFHVGLPFCCAGCVADGPCICSYDEAPARPGPAAHRRMALRQPPQAPARLPAAAATPAPVRDQAPDLAPVPASAAVSASGRRAGARRPKERTVVAAR